MTLHTLFVCKTCSAEIDHEAVTETTVTEGKLLLQRLQDLGQAGGEPRELSELNVQAVGCLWTCDRPCAVTFACPGKYTYHFVNLHRVDSVPELQAFSQLYIQSPDGYVKPPQMPGDLRSRLLVRVPPVPEVIAPSATP